MYCKDISGLISWFGVHYNASDWRLFIDSSQSSLKGVFLLNGNTFASIPVAHWIHLRETYDSLKHLLHSVNYKAHGWLVCEDFKVTALLRGLQVGYTKMHCFLCEWGSRAQSEQWERYGWPQRKSLTPGSKNVIHEPLADRDKVLLPPLHIKLGIMEQFLRALDKDGDCFKFICQKFCAVTHGKLQAAVFTGPQIHKVMRDIFFENSMNQLEEQEHGRASKTLWHTSCETDGGQITRILCKICWRT